VVLESFLPRVVLVFPSDLANICLALRKLHPNQATVLQFTQANYRTIMGDVDRFTALDMQVFDLRRQADDAVARATIAPSP